MTRDGEWLMREFAPRMLREAGMEDEAALLDSIENPVESHPALGVLRTRAEYAAIEARKRAKDLLPRKSYLKALSGSHSPFIREAAEKAVAARPAWPGSVLPWAIGLYASQVHDWNSLCHSVSA